MADTDKNARSPIHTRRIESLEIPGPAGRLEALLEEPPDAPPRMAALVCHPHPLYGGTMHNKVVYRLARGLRRTGIVALRFNFRGVGRSEGEHGNLTGEIEDARAALAFLRGRYPSLPFALAGFSFGARAITRLGCEIERANWLLWAAHNLERFADRVTNICERTVFIVTGELHEFTDAEKELWGKR
jgi:alpha/beta superfamily hydrolase